MVNFCNILNSYDKTVQIYNNFRKHCFSPYSQVVAIGNFDGVHLGHRSLFELAISQAQELGLQATVLTFCPHPLKLLFPDRRIFLITSYERKANLIAACGIDNLVIAPFDHQFANLTADEFVKKVLIHHLGAAVVVVGNNYTFGRNREGSLAHLQKLGRDWGFAVEIAQPYRLDGELVSSTKIREAIMQGEIEKASRFLGRPCAIVGRVIRGKGRGQGIGFPTANLVSEVELYPKEGVYAVWAEYQGERYMGVVNIGYNPTFADTGLTVEAHILDFDQDLYDQDLKIIFVKHLRSEKTCSGIEELRQLIAADVSKTRQLLMG
ncbi:MAG: bifunctional riboflavin kinase/FAD synthetase [Deltaproteobacteria bacterium]|nr:bifunctional riboflavin kinase/FAD synthetase [Candidatus Tharpella sp.]